MIKRRWFAYSDEGAVERAEEYYKNKYNTDTIITEFGLESVRDGEVGINVSFLVVPNFNYQEKFGE